MEHDKFEAVNQCIREAAQQAAATGGLAVPTIELFLRTSEETWDGAGSGRFSPAQFTNNEAKPPSGENRHADLVPSPF
jgi:hypothetical protein